jgi:alginate O-acetyltransferase complex protein AlgI
MSFQSLAFFGFLAAALAVCLTAGRRSPAFFWG